MHCTAPDGNVQISIVRMLQNPAFTNEMKTFDFAKSCTALGHALEHTAMTSECAHLPHHEVHVPAHITANVTTSTTAWLGQHSRQQPSLLHTDVGKWTDNSFKLTQMDPNWLLKGLSLSWGQSGGLFLDPCICIQHFPGPWSTLPVFSGRNKC